MSSWNDSQLLAVFCYAIKFSSNEAISDAVSDRLRALDGRPNAEKIKELSQMVASSILEFEKFFRVPRTIPDNETNELVAGFIDFLLQLLDCESPLENSPGEDENRIATLQRELKCLATVLGDVLMVMHSDFPEAGNLVEKFQYVANEAGRLIFSRYFGHGSNSDDMHKGLIDLLEKIDLLNADIRIRFSDLPSCMTPITAVDSLFIVGSLIDDIGDLMKEGVEDLADGLKEHFGVLDKELRILRSLFEEMMMPNPSEVEELKELVKRIRDLAYEAEYLISSFAIGDVPVWYLALRLPAVVDKIKPLRISVQEIKRGFDTGVLKVAEEFSDLVLVQEKRNPKVENIVVGFDDAAKEILDALMGGSGNLKTVFIHGMPGLGKTTLAQMLYDNCTTVYHFDKCAWCVVSQMYRRRNLLIEILSGLVRDLEKETILGMDDQDLAEQIHKTLKGRRYLIVMDDIWSSVVWDDFRRYFPDDQNGSRVLFTSRNKDVAPDGSIIHEPPFLSHDQCWFLLKLKALRGDPCPPYLIDVGMKIARLCNQLPLAVVITAGILANLGRKETAWRKVEESLALYFFTDPNNPMKILELSYKHLPDHLKPCFLYFGAFPEDIEIPKWKLISLWIAEGFIPKDDKNSTECVAEKYLLHLIDRSLVQISRNGFSGAIKACRIHDLLRELCLMKSQHENFLKLIQGHLPVYQKHQRLFPLSPTWSRPFGLHLRAYLGYLSDLFYCLPGMKRLKVLDLSTRMLDHNEQERIGLLVNLRYLALGWVPSSISSCVNLEFLHVESTTPVTIPPILLKMLKLRYLHIETEAKFEKDCHLTHTNNLHTLSCVQLYNLEDEDILKYCPHLRKLKCLCEPFLLNRQSDAYCCPDLSFLSQLESLKMIFGSSFRGEYAVINFPRGIRKLSLSNIGLPWKKMSIIGRLPKLEVLKLVSNAFEGKRWQTRNGEFQQLRFLKLERLKFSRWIVASSKHFPRLERLTMYKCYNLLKIPSELGDVVTLQLIEAHSCGIYVRNSAAKIKEEQMEYGNEELKVIITDDIW